MPSNPSNPLYPDPAMEQDLPLESTIEALQSEVSPPPEPPAREILESRMQALIEAWNAWQEAFREELHHLHRAMESVPALSGKPEHTHSHMVALHAIREIETLGKALQKRLEYPLGNIPQDAAQEIQEILGRASAEKERRKALLQEDQVPKLRTIVEAGGKPQAGVQGKPTAKHLRMTLSLTETAKIVDPEAVPREFCQPSLPLVNAGLRTRPGEPIPGIETQQGIKITLPQSKKGQENPESQNPENSGNTKANP